MAARKEPSKGNKPDKLIRDALMLALNREDVDAEGKKTKKLNLVAAKLVEKAISGDVQAIKEVADRVDGKAVQPIAGDPEAPMSFIMRWANAQGEATSDPSRKS